MATQKWRGERLGLPERGPGSVASTGIRLAHLLVDLVLASLVTSVFFRPQFDQPEVMQTFNYWALLTWFVIAVVPVSLAGFTPGMALLGLRVVRMDGTPMVGPLRAIPRTLLTALVIPAAIWDRDGRAWHDKVAGTILLRTR